MFIIEIGQVVEIYRNLHKNTLSIRDKQTKYVIGYTDTIKIKGKFKVSEAGRQRVLKEKRKNVHAYIVGEILSFDVSDANPYFQAYYNPYTTEYFIDHCSKERLEDDYIIWLNGKDIFYEKLIGGNE